MWKLNGISEFLSNVFLLVSSIVCWEWGGAGFDGFILFEFISEE